MNKRRLHALIKFMDKVPAKRFTMDWFSNAGFNKQISLKSDCGASACALGWATAIPSFRRAGLRMIDAAPASTHMPKVTGFELAREFFDLTERQTIRLFRDASVRTPKEWAKMAARYIQECEKEVRVK